LAVVATTSAPPRPATARRTTIALKILMAATGLVFVGYVLLHMYGNLKALSGEESFNTYAEHLRTFGEPMLPYGGLLWAIRALLVVSLIGHGYAAFQLWARAGNARRSKYAAGRTVLRTTWMRWGGVFLLLFIVWHLLHFTIAKISPNAAANGPDVVNNPYRLVVASFQVPWMTLIYVLAMVALALHLAHGVFSAMQTLGWTSTPKAYRRAQLLGNTSAVVIAGGFLIPPLAILFGLIK
jgi:succinate dehydrogenase / fumarate reductase cytochrome b subunit